MYVREKKESQHDRGHMLFMGGVYELTSCITALKRADEDNWNDWIITWAMACGAEYNVLPMWK